ncbi:hypothetical protein MBOURGENBZM_20950 [Methanoculleus bourgensis]|nr:hypothetical protein MBOURGENBZM_20950 [Methanoculleus bourgensis]
MREDAGLSRRPLDPFSGSGPVGSIREQRYLNKKEANIKFTQPDNQQYCLVIDNTYLMTNGASSGRTVSYSITISLLFQNEHCIGQKLSGRHRGDYFFEVILKMV